MLTGCTGCHQIECCIVEWYDGTWKESNWREERYKATYLSHLNTLRDLRNHGQRRQGGDLLAQIQHDLLRGARSVSPLSIMDTLSDTLIAALEAYTRVPHPIL
jgi:Domain of unknown function (DUF6532)